MVEYSRIERNWANSAGTGILTNRALEKTIMHTRLAIRRFTTAGVALLCLLCGSLQAQETRGTILGRVTDSSGAVIVGAKVTAINTTTQVQTFWATNASGDYLLPLLNPGTYDLTAKIAGFKTYRRLGIPVRVVDRVTIDIALEIGEISEQVKVVGEAPLIEAATASTGQVMDNKSIIELPNLDGNPLMLSSLAVGVLNFTPASGTMASAMSGPSSFSVDGVRTNYNDFSMDGAPNTQRGIIAYAPPADMVQEFKIQTATFDVTQGFTPGATVNVSLKSGANDLHGNLLYFAQNPAFNANKFFSNLAGLPKAVLRFNRYGANGSGPVYIPKLYNGQESHVL
jgi:hypothetical protein